MIIFNSTKHIGDNFQPNMESITQRIKQVSDILEIKVSDLEKQIGASKGVLSRAISQNTDIHSKWLGVIVENYPQISAEWLLTGNGQMLKNQVLKSEKEGGGLVTQQMIDKITEQAEEIARLKIEIEEYKKTISSLKDRIEVVPDAKCAIAG